MKELKEFKFEVESENEKAFRVGSYVRLFINGCKTTIQLTSKSFAEFIITKRLRTKSKKLKVIVKCIESLCLVQISNYDTSKFYADGQSLYFHDEKFTNRYYNDVKITNNYYGTVGVVVSSPTVKNNNLIAFLHKDEFEKIKQLIAKNVEIKSSLPYILSTNHLNDLADFCYEESKRKGWHTEKELNLAAFLTNLHGEISELWEAYRKGKLNELCDKAEEMSKHGIEPLTCMEEELADIFIRTEDLCKTYNIDITKAIKNKILYNRKRPHRNGGKLI